MAVIIRVEIHNNETLLASIKNMGFLVPVLLRLFAEDTALIMFVDFFEVFHAPRRPDSIHYHPFGFTNL